MNRDCDIGTLHQWIADARRIVFFGGAGVSTESGIPDFRSTDGLYHQQYEYPPEQILSRQFFTEKADIFYSFYREKMIMPDAKPNAAHNTLAIWEKMGKLSAVITQNIDGLHQAAGSTNVLELHGSLHRNHCTRCGAFFGLTAIAESTGIPRCACGGIIKPDVVLYGESLDNTVIEMSVTALSDADVLIVAGTSLSVYPAAGLIDAYCGQQLILINRTETQRDRRANLVIRGNVGEILSGVPK